MYTQTVSRMVYQLENIALEATSDSDVRNQLLTYLASIYARRVEQNFDDEQWRGYLLCARDVLDTQHPRYDLISSAIMAAMIECAESQHAG